MKKYLFRKTIVVCLTALLVFSLAGCGSSEKKPSLRFGTNAENPPFTFVVQNGVFAQYEGIDMTIVKKVSAENGYMPRIENMETDEFIRALQNGNIDCIIASMPITEDAQEDVDFSISYYDATQVLLVRADAAITSVADLVDKKVCAVQGYPGAELADSWQNLEVVGFGYTAEGMLKSNQCDAMILDKSIAEAYVKNDAYKMVEDAEVFSTVQYGVAVKKGNTTLLDKINSVLQKMLDDGTISGEAYTYFDGQKK